MNKLEIIEVANNYNDHDHKDIKLALQSALLAKAVEALEFYACWEDCNIHKYKDGSCSQGDSCGKKAQTTLAEINKGDNDAK